MTSRERVLTALKRKQPDRVPWVESSVHNWLAEKLLVKPVSPATHGLRNGDTRCYRVSKNGERHMMTSASDECPNCT